ncbi:RNA polymerase sigma factor [Streptococcus acidominimus]|uniref:Sigma-70 family RNA polymerase sigma factor n=1 Tax=Streptococcus acidominimus TaxID=1326 RepID=A0A4Y9FSD6_STRAI|nr:sigma-70 family RNA polymerase sigma factor [Streptococcus acidominimus]MBF0818530.1 sigma-70 family RNA polymerase sigma factor [Streptococcus acidominimus]MBF0839109.1 sigma-70 family RNA polymerase sigma factor [Streptococcus acidominimus]MBF0848770.1 sigma-70 family RNA polymerase sigma factor [Streptococcus danieliae]TFU31168.1 sigma-70 family RNA polymerase sigma factor [Streptococcus acidominimus]
MIGFAGDVISYLMKSGVSKEQAEDVVQDIFVKMLELPVAIPGENIRAFMYRSAIRRYIDKYRRDRRYMEILRQEFFKTPELSLFETDQYDFLVEEVERLPRKDALLLDLFYFQNFLISEIAELLSYSVSKVKIGLHRSRQKLKKALKQKGYDHGNI